MPLRHKAARRGPEPVVLKTIQSLARRIVVTVTRTERRTSIVAAAAAIAIAATLLGSSGLGSYLDRVAFYQPARHLQAGLGLRSKIDSRIRLVVLEDRSLTKLDRFPRFVDWYQIAKLLFAQGFRQVFLFGAHDLGTGLKGMTTARHERGQLVVGTVVTRDAANMRAIAPSALDARLVARSSAPPDEMVSVGSLVGLNPEVLSFVDRVGHLNLQGAYEIRTRIGIGDGRLLPAIGLWTLDGRDDAGGLDELLQRHEALVIDYVDPTTLASATTPASAFFAGGEVFGALTAKVKERLSGGEVAVLVPDAYTGARFVQSEFGEVPSYLAGVSVISSALAGRFTTRLSLAATTLLPVAVLALLAASMPAFGAAVALLALLAILVAALAFAGLAAGGILLPGAQLVVLVLVALAVRLTQHVMRIVVEKLKLRSDLELGRSVQAFTLPAVRAGTGSGWNFRFMHEPWGAMSGDWLQAAEFTRHGRKEAVLAIGDVVGKGPSAALITAVIAAIFREEAAAWEGGGVAVDLDHLIARLDVAIRRTFSGHQFSTMSVAHLAEGKVRFGSFGAPGWMRFDLAGPQVKAHRLPVPCINPLGIMSGTEELVWHEVEVGATNILFAFTDGLLNGGRDMARLSHSLMVKPIASRDAKLIDKLQERAREVGATSTLDDDTTMLFVTPSEAARDGVESFDR